MKKIVFAFFCVATFMLSCTVTHKVYLDSYIAMYYDVDEICLFGVGQYITIYSGALPAVESPPLGSVSVVEYDSDGNKKQVYDRLCVKHNDTSYNRKVEVDNNIGFYRRYLAIDFISIDVVSDADYNDLHESGASLNDIIRFYSISPYPYISSGYRAKFDWSDYDVPDILSFVQSAPVSERVFLHPVNKVLDEITALDLILLGDGVFNPLCVLKLEELPTLSKEHTLTITLTADDGRVFTAAIEMVFE